MTNTIMMKKPILAGWSAQADIKFGQFKGGEPCEHVDDKLAMHYLIPSENYSLNPAVFIY